MEDIKDQLSNVNWVEIGGQILLALVILVVTWIVAKVVKWIFGKLASNIPALQKAGADGENLGQSLGSIGSLLVWLFGLMAVLQVFGLTQVLQPIQDLLGGIFGYLPNIIGAGFVFFVGFMIARIVRQIVETALGAVPFDRLTSRTGGEDQPAGAGSEGGDSGIASALPRTLALILYALIMIVVTIAALQVLAISAISDPATQMLNLIFNAIPSIIAAAIVLGIGVLIARFAGDILQQLLDGLGTDRALREMEVLPEGRSASPIIGRVAQVAIVLFFAVAAAQLLAFPQITQILNEVLNLGGRVLFGGAIVAVGFFIANLLARLVSGNASTVIRYATLVLFAAMGLQYMGIADSVINLAFGALVVGGAAAAALAFGLGGRDAAARQLDRMSQDQGPGPGSGGNHSAST